MSEGGDIVVRVENVVKDFRPGFGLRTKRVLHGISLEVSDGETFGFVGPNGAGKTTTLKILMGLVRATSGRCSILGHDVGETAFRRHVGFLPENSYLYDYLTGRELLDFYARLSGVERRRRPERVETLLDWVGLTDAADARLRTYSKGMQQRVGIAQALVHDPRVVFLDEPMSGLDPIGRKEIRDLILRLRDEGKTVFMNTHILHDVEMTCDRVAIIVEGRIRYAGRIEDFLNAGEREADLILERLSSEAAAELEQRFEATIQGLGERSEVRVREKDVDAVLAHALQLGVSVTSVTPHRVSLESIFLSAVEEGQP
ncbi:MAG: ABC transporter ATP-binding protein [Proteobacteria bacterium]|nr:ABC transporter ATP-binding protein [Pseudomonadota bacterium]